MSLKFHPVQRMILAGEEKGEEKFFGQVRCGEAVSFEQLCKRISVLSSATPGDVAGVIDGLETLMVEQLEMGNILRIDDLGNFRLSVKSRGADSREGFNVSYIKKPGIVFTPGKLLKRVCNEVSFERIKPNVVVEEIECEKNHVV